MNKNRLLSIILIVTAVFSAAVVIIKCFAVDEKKFAKIYQNGELVREIKLDTLDAPVEFDIKDRVGHVNIVRAERGRICMLSADCPDKLCVNQGWITNGVVPVVCLPNKVTIEITGTEKKTDAQSGGIPPVNTERELDTYAEK